MNKRLTTLAIAGTIGIAGLAGAGAVSAMQGSDSSSNSLIDRIAEKFNLNRDEVASVFDEDKEAKEAEHQAKLSERLQKAVDAGKITADQKSAIEAKLADLRDARESEQAALETWADENNIDLKYLMGRGRGGDNWLDKAVENGDITDEQKQTIETKREELKDAREAKQDELEQWAEENNIDEKYLSAGIGFGFGFGGREHDRHDK